MGLRPFGLNFLLKQRVSCSRHSHTFKNKLPTSSSDCSQAIVKDIIYNNNDIIAFNKPYGVSFSTELNLLKNTTSDYEVTLKSMLVYIQELVGHRILLGAKVPEKFNSGVSIFCSNEDTLKRIKKCLKVMRDNGDPSDTYLALVVGHPKEAVDRFKGAVTLQTTDTSKEKKIMFVTEFSKNAVSKGLVKRVSLSHKTLSSSEHASLVQVQATRNKWHSVRAYLATRQLSPVIGDDLFGSRVKKVLGIPVLIDPFNQAALSPQKLPHEMMKLLNIESRKDVLVPLHLHLSHVLIKDFFKKGEHLELEAPLPEIFKWTCGQLDIEINRGICTEVNQM